MTLHDADGASVRRVVPDPLGEGGYLGVDAGPVDPRALLASRYYPDLDGDLAASPHTQPPQRAPGVTLAIVNIQFKLSGNHQQNHGIMGTPMPNKFSFVISHTTATPGRQMHYLRPRPDG